MINVTIIKETKSVKLPGHYYTIVMFLCLFLSKYYFGYLEATELDYALRYSTIETAVTSLFSGYFLGKVMSYLLRAIQIKFYNTHTLKITAL